MQPYGFLPEPVSNPRASKIKVIASWDVTLVGSVFDWGVILIKSACDWGITVVKVDVSRALLW
jgi:hypothetical protein